MSVRQAVLSDLNIIKQISEVTIAEIYPRYYPKGAVDFFLAHHSEDNILSDIKGNRIFLCLDIRGSAVGTVTIKENEICRLFVLPLYQGKGYGTELLDYAEKKISCEYSKVVLAASLPAKKMYLKRGYKDTEFHIIVTKNTDFLCYDAMEKQLILNEAKSEKLLDNIDKIHTTEMGLDRIRKNLKLETYDVVEYCKNKISDKNCHIYRQGKNWYCEVDNIRITINSYSYTIITAHII